jgi:hypothetical protein
MLRVEAATKIVHYPSRLHPPNSAFLPLQVPYSAWLRFLGRVASVRLRPCVATNLRTVDLWVRDACAAKLPWIIMDLPG